MRRFACHICYCRGEVHKRCVVMQVAPGAPFTLSPLTSELPFTEWMEGCLVLTDSDISPFRVGDTPGQGALRTPSGQPCVHLWQLQHLSAEGRITPYTTIRLIR